MATLVKTKRRINSVTSTRKITNAMELVASVKLKRFKGAMHSVEEYTAAIKEIAKILSAHIDDDEKFLANKTNQKLYIIVNSNLGLCASYNNDIFKFASSLLKKEDEIIPLGLKGYTHFKNLNFKLNEHYVSLNEKINFDDINKFSKFILSEYNAKKYREVYIIYMDYINTITFVPKVKQVLPFTGINDSKPSLLPPIMEPNAKVLLEQLSPIYLASQIYQAIIISQVSEQASRRTAMENATDNADEILDKLKLEYNKARQGAITQEITEVIAGANE